MPVRKEVYCFTIMRLVPFRGLVMNIEDGFLMCLGQS